MLRAMFRRTTLALLVVAGCGSPASSPDAAPSPVDSHPAPDAELDAPPPDALPPPDAADPIYGDVYAAVSQDALITFLKQMSGVEPVTIEGDTFSISERYSDEGRQHFLTWWKYTFGKLGYTVRAIDYQGPNSSRPGHDLEAVLPGASTDSIVVIVHYDSIGPFGMETTNPGVDDDMTGMAIAVETARILASYRGRLEHTIRFVAADEEELGDLAGARAYAKQIKTEALAGHWRVLSAIDDEQTGWNCHTDGLCGSNQQWPVFDVFSCGDGYNFQALGDQLADVVHTYSTLAVERGCMGANSDHYAMWEAGIPAVVFSEHNPFANPHFDQNGGDTFDKIDQDYFTSIAKPAITFAAELVGIRAAQ
jgi:hypothetical protein